MHTVTAQQATLTASLVDKPSTLVRLFVYRERENSRCQEHAVVFFLGRVCVLKSVVALLGLFESVL